jgi:hypothetical protein
VQVVCNFIEKRSALRDVPCLLWHAVWLKSGKLFCGYGVAGWHNLDSAGIHSGDLQNEHKDKLGNTQ